MRSPLPGYIQLYPTTKCNQRCLFCFNQKADILPDLTFANALLLLDILSDNGINDMDIMGGEPFLLSWMSAFIREGLSRGMSLNISTNGSLPVRLKELKDISPEHFNIGISLEGSTEERHGSLTGSGNFQSAIESIHTLQDISLDPLVKTVLNRETLPDIQNIIDLIRGTGVRRYYLIHMDLLSEKQGSPEISISYPEFLAFYHEIRKSNIDMEVQSVAASCFDTHSLPPGVRCAGGVKKLSMLPDGTVFPCNLFHSFPEFGVGNIFRDNLPDIWRHQRFDFFRRHTENRCVLTDCAHRSVCTGGCPAHCYSWSKELDGPDRRCFKAPGRLQTTDS